MSLDNSAVVPALPTGYDIPYSVQFSGDQWLIKTDGSGDRQKFTASFWFKRTRLGSQEEFWNCTDNATGDFLLRFVDDHLDLYDQAGRFVTNAKYRDTASWMHCVLRVDTTQSTSSNRLRLYINGEQVTSFSTFTTPSQNASFNVGRSGYRHIFGAYWTNYPSGIRGQTHLLLSEFHLVHGQSLDPSNFGQFNDYGGWEAIEYTGSHGTNGYYHKFDNASNLGDVEVGANFTTVHNLSARYQLIDSPTNNFATFNGVASHIGTVDLSEGNLRAYLTSGFNTRTISTFAPTSGKWYWELEANDSNGNHGVGVFRVDANIHDSSTSLQAGYYANGEYKIEGNSQTSGFSSYGSGDIIGVAFDADSNKIYWHKNNTWQNSANPSTGTNGISLTAGQQYVPFYMHGSGSSSSSGTANFGQDSSFAGNKTAQGNTDGNNIGDFYYTPPSGYLALCTANLPDPDVIPSEHFNTVLWTGDGSSSNAITGVGFEPDLVWTKARNYARHHWWYDQVRGVKKWLQSSNDDYEASGDYGLISFNTDGFTYKAGGDFNTNGQTFASWNWKANGSGSSNTDGSVTSTVSANQDAGFSIVKWTGTSSTITVGHGLSKAPELIIAKSLESDAGTYQWTNWTVGHTSLGWGDNSTIRLELTDGVFDGYSTAPWANTAPASSVFTVGSATAYGGAGISANGQDQIAYCFHSVDGFSNFGSYTGNGSSDGTFVYTGFRPAWVMIKRTDSSDNWTIMDTERSPYNYADDFLIANGTSTESNRNITGGFDIVSNGFKIRHGDGSVNANGGTYIYIAFAETPFKYTNAR